MCLLPLNWVSVDPTSPLRVCLPLHAQIVMQVWERCERTRGVACLEQVDVVVFFYTLWKSRGVGGCLKGRDRKPNSEMWNMGSILRLLSDLRWEEWRCFACPLFLQDGCIQQLGSLSGCCVMQFYLLPALSTDLRCVYKLGESVSRQSLNTPFMIMAPGAKILFSNHTGTFCACSDVYFLLSGAVCSPGLQRLSNITCTQHSSSIVGIKCLTFAFDVQRYGKSWRAGPFEYLMRSRKG